jgi:hypothetical protein
VARHLMKPKLDLRKRKFVLVPPFQGSSLTTWRSDVDWLRSAAIQE